ncbi:hypothetical protein D1007_41573 [Hordeum vulgare]|nr:hypothetical protein D1007_41573 [Hordeum vulgare]
MAWPASKHRRHLRRVLASLLGFEHQHRGNESTDGRPGAVLYDQDNVPEMLMFSLLEARRCTEPTPAMLSPKDNQICFATPPGLDLRHPRRLPVGDWLWHPLTVETMPLPPIRDDQLRPQ